MIGTSPEGIANYYRNEWSVKSTVEIVQHRDELIALNARSAYPQYAPSIKILDDILASRA